MRALSVSLIFLKGNSVSYGTSYLEMPDSENVTSDQIKCDLTSQAHTLRDLHPATRMERMEARDHVNGNVVSGTPKREHIRKVLVVGAPKVGKTSLIRLYAYNTFEEDYGRSIGVDFATKRVKLTNDLTLQVQLWDIAGQEHNTSLTRAYYRDADACIVMCDVTRRETWLNSALWRVEVDMKCIQRCGNPIPCLLIANKCDLPDREVETGELEAFCKKYSFLGFGEISVKEDIMVEECMRKLAMIHSIATRERFLHAIAQTNPSDSTTKNLAERNAADTDYCRPIRN